LALNKDIEDQFSSAVKTALDTSQSAVPPPEAIGVPLAQASAPRGHHAWAVALLCLAFVAIATIVFITILHVRGVSVPFLSDEMATMWPGDGADKPNPVPAASANSTGGARASATPAATATPDASAHASEPTAAVDSTAAASNLAPAPAPTASGNSELRQPLALPPVSPSRTQAARHTRAPADASVGSSSSAPTRKRTEVATIASARGLQYGPPAPADRIPAAPAAAVSAPRAKVESTSAPPAPTSAARSVLVSSPDRTVIWALEDSGTIFRWTDQKSWQQLGSGVKADLLAGQASSNTVCWVVGRHGTILLTTDGKRWQQIKSPTNADIVGVSVISADVADIVVADGSHLSTIDRGGYWMPTL
jgi:hypothetical protein